MSNYNKASCTYTELIARLQLIRSFRIGPVNFKKLMDSYGSATEALCELPNIAKEKGLQNYSVFLKSNAVKEYEKGHKRGWKLIAQDDVLYPSLLRSISDAPPLLWAAGSLALCEQPILAIVGSRHASALGLRTTKHLANQLSEAGIVIVSGMANGIDTVAHHASLDHGTISIWAGGLMDPYPVQNLNLAKEIEKTGLILSEQPLSMKPQAKYFPRRNRIISGIAQAVLVVEATAKSGTLITAKNALDQGREIFAVPGHPFDPRANGTNGQ